MTYSPKLLLILQRSPVLISTFPFLKSFQITVDTRTYPFKLDTPPPCTSSSPSARMLFTMVCWDHLIPGPKANHMFRNIESQLLNLSKVNYINLNKSYLKQKHSKTHHFLLVVTMLRWVEWVVGWLTGIKEHTNSQL